MKIVLSVIIFTFVFFSSSYAANDKSCSDGYSFYKTNASNKAFPIFKIESSSNKKIQITKIEIKGFNDETIYEADLNLIIDPYSVKKFEPFNLLSGILSLDKIPNLNPKVINNYYLSCKWFDEQNSKTKLENQKTFLMCGGSSISYPRFPETYDEYLNDNNFYYAISEDKIFFLWHWKTGQFYKKLPIIYEDQEKVTAISKKFWDTDSTDKKWFLSFDKYSMTMTISQGYLDKNLFTKDKVKTRSRSSKCSTIDKSKLGRLKPRVN